MSAELAATHHGTLVAQLMLGSKAEWQLALPTLAVELSSLCVAATYTIDDSTVWIFCAA